MAFINDIIINFYHPAYNSAIIIEYMVIRNRKNISIEIVCEKTKISKNIIESIESGNFNNISDTYIKLYLK